MFKKLILALLVTVAISSVGTTVFAVADKDKLTDWNAISTEEFLVTITRPEGDESTFKNSYVICGNSAKENITVELLIVNEKTNLLEPFKNTNGESLWKIGTSGVFIKEVVLPNVGPNRIRIAAYSENEPEKLQFRNYTITVLDQKLKDVIKNGMDMVTDAFSGLFSK